MKTRKLGMVVAASLIAVGDGSAMAQRAPLHIEGRMLVQVIGEVKAVDVAAHRVTVVDAQGNERQLNVSSGMHDLDKLPLGTRVKSGALQPVTLTPVRQAKLQEALPGDKRFVARVTSIDAASGVVMLKDADGLPIEVRTRNSGEAGALSNGETVRVDVVSDRSSTSPKKH